MTTADEYKAEANRDATVSPNRVTVLYADHGKRKTTTAVSMVKDRGLLISSDDSWKVLEKSIHEELFNKVKIIPYDGISQLDYVDFEGDEKGKFDTVIWDTFSQSTDEYLDLLLDKGTWQTNYREAISSKDPELKNKAIPGWTDYRLLRDVFRPTLNRLFKNTDAHIVFTSQVRYPIPGFNKGESAIIRPDVSAATFKIVGTRADLIGYLQPAPRGKFTIDLTENSIVSLGKSRLEGLEGKIDLDTFVSNYRKIVF